MTAEVKFDFKEIDMKLAEYINDNAEKIAKKIARDARASVNVITGNLKKGIRAKESRFDDGGWIVVSTAPHSHLVEYGHGGPKPAPAHSYLRKSLFNNIEEARQIFGAK